MEQNIIDVFNILKILSFSFLYSQGYYDTMDAGYMDEDEYLYVMSRVDDVINVAGHRISAGAIEEASANQPDAWK